MPCPVGETREIRIGGRTLKVRNPGTRAVMEAQEECMGPGGRLSPSKYIALIGSRWTEPPIDLNWFRHEGEVVEFLREWDAFRRPEPFSVTADAAYCPEGKTVTITLSSGKKLRVVNPGMKWVLEAQDDATTPTGRLSLLRYAERVLRDCVVGGASIEDFQHEEEVLEFLRLFRLVRVPPTENSGGETETKVGGSGKKGT